MSEKDSQSIRHLDFEAVEMAARLSRGLEQCLIWAWMSLRSPQEFVGERGKRPAQDLVVPSDSEHVGDRLRPNFRNRQEIMDALLDQQKH